MFSQRKKIQFLFYLSHKFYRHLFCAGMTEWIDNWLDNGFRKADGGPVKNRDDFMELYDLCGQFNVAFVSLNAHKLSRLTLINLQCKNGLVH